MNLAQTADPESERERERETLGNRERARTATQSCILSAVESGAECSLTCQACVVCTVLPAGEAS